MADFFSNLDGVASLGGLLPAGAEELLNKPTITEDLTSSGNQILPNVPVTTVAKTMVFTAPVDCTIRNLVGLLNSKTASDPLEYVNWNYYNTIGTITVAGTGPDVGSHVEGFGVPGAMFSPQNILKAPQLNLRLDAGDTVSFTLYNITDIFGTETIPYNYVLTYDEGQDTSVKPTHFVGGPAASGHRGIFGGGTAASGTITVTAAAVTVGDTIVLVGWPFSALAVGEIGSTLTAEAGGGGSGFGTWDSNDDATITATRDAILLALSDVANQWDGEWTFVASGANAITVTRDDAGSIGNADAFRTTGANLSTSGSGFLTGGVGAVITASAFATPSVGVTLDRLYMVSIGGGMGGIPPLVIPANIVVTALNVGGSPDSSFGQGSFSPNLNKIEVLHGSVVVPSATTLSVDAHIQYNGGGAYFVLAGVVT